MHLEPTSQTGSITLLGGGPGALDLLTLRGVHALADAEVIFADRLGPAEHLPLLAPQAKIIDVGKLPGHHKLTQREIEAQMIETARGGANVVRLKGGGIPLSSAAATKKSPRPQPQESPSTSSQA